MKKFEEIKRILLSSLPEKLCSPGLNDLENATGLNAFFRLYATYIDFCLNNEFPSIELLKANFSLVDLNRNGIFLDQDIEISGDLPFIVLLGKCKAEILITDYLVSQIFVKHESCISLLAKGNSYVLIDAFDQSSVIANTLEDARIYLNLFNVSDVKLSGNVIVNQKGKDKY